MLYNIKTPLIVGYSHVIQYEDTKNKNKTNRLIMDQLVIIILLIDKAHTLEGHGLQTRL